MTPRLAEALKRHKHRRGTRVLTDSAGMALTYKMTADRVRRAAINAGLGRKGVHILRHTFCSRLGMRGAPLFSVKELAGHQSVTTTQRYVHVTAKALEDAIQLLVPTEPSERGDIGETPTS